MKKQLLILVIALLVAVGPANAGWFDSVKDAIGISGESSQKAETSEDSSPSSGAPAEDLWKGLTQVQVQDGLKEELFQAIQIAVENLGKPDGFLSNELVRIAMPSQLAQVDSALRKIGQGALADQFIASMNHAAEKAVPETMDVFTKAAKAMSIEDAVNIVQGPENAATVYFEEHTRTELAQRIQPLVDSAMDAARVTHYYQLMMNKAQSYVPFLSSVAPDLDQYVTGKTMDGLFTMMAQEEKNIRQNPQARTTELLKKVFGN